MRAWSSRCWWSARPAHADEDALQRAFALGMQAQQTGDLARAEAIFREMLTSTQSPRVKLELARTLFAQAKYDGSESAVQGSVGAVGNAVARARQHRAVRARNRGARRVPEVRCHRGVGLQPGQPRPAEGVLDRRSPGHAGRGAEAADRPALLGAGMEAVRADRRRRLSDGVVRRLPDRGIRPADGRRRPRQEPGRVGPRARQGGPGVRHRRRTAACTSSPTWGSTPCSRNPKRPGSRASSSSARCASPISTISMRRIAAARCRCAAN